MIIRSPEWFQMEIWHIRKHEEINGKYWYNQDGYLMTKEKWEQIKKEVDQFFEIFGEDAVKQHNMEVEEENKQAIREHESNITKITRPGFVYLLRADNGLVKIGKTGKITKRIYQLSIQLPYETELIHTIKTDDMDELERHLHEIFAAKRKRGEWFELSEEDITSIKQNFSASS